MLNAPATLKTARLTLRRPRLEDAARILPYAGDPAVTRYMGWTTRRDLEHTREYLEMALEEWQTDGCGTYIIEREGMLIGSTGLYFCIEQTGTTGYILAPSAWGQGFATEACRAMIELGRSLGLARIEAQCHVDHRASARVLEKSGMSFEGVLCRKLIFPNLSFEPEDVRSYAWVAS